MNNSMISAMVSMGGIQQRLDMISDNIANLDTVGYKRKEATFEDTLTAVQQQISDLKLPGRVTPLGFNLGFGSNMAGVSINFERGSIKETGNSTDLAIEGNALFTVLTPEGEKAYTRAGDFHIQPDPADPDSAYLVTNQGYVVLNAEGDPVKVPAKSKLAIDDKGNIRATVGSTVTDAGRIALMTPKRPDGLEQKDGNLFMLAPGAAENAVMVDTTTLPEKEQAHIRQGALEASNVSLTDSMTDMMQVQRAYQLSARALTSSERMMELANNLRG